MSIAVTVTHIALQCSSSASLHLCCTAFLCCAARRRRLLAAAAQVVWLHSIKTFSQSPPQPRPPSPLYPFALLLLLVHGTASRSYEPQEQHQHHPLSRLLLLQPPQSLPRRELQLFGEFGWFAVLAWLASARLEIWTLYNVPTRCSCSLPGSVCCPSLRSTPSLPAAMKPWSKCRKIAYNLFTASRKKSREKWSKTTKTDEKNEVQ